MGTQREEPMSEDLMSLAKSLRKMNWLYVRKRDVPSGPGNDWVRTKYNAFGSATAIAMLRKCREGFLSDKGYSPEDYEFSEQREF